MKAWIKAEANYLYIGYLKETFLGEMIYRNFVREIENPLKFHGKLQAYEIILPMELAHDYADFKMNLPTGCIITLD